MSDTEEAAKYILLDPFTFLPFRVPEEAIVHDMVPVCIEFDRFLEIATSGSMNAETVMCGSNAKDELRSSFRASNIVGVHIGPTEPQAAMEDGMYNLSKCTFAWGTRMMVKCMQMEGVDNAGGRFLWLWSPTAAFNSWNSLQSVTRASGETEREFVFPHEMRLVDIRPSHTYVASVFGGGLGPRDVHGCTPMNIDEMAPIERMLVASIRPQCTMCPRRRHDGIENDWEYAVRSAVFRRQIRFDNELFIEWKLKMRMKEKYQASRRIKRVRTKVVVEDEWNSVFNDFVGAAQKTTRTQTVLPDDLVHRIMCMAMGSTLLNDGPAQILRTTFTLRLVSKHIRDEVDAFLLPLINTAIEKSHGLLIDQQCYGTTCFDVGTHCRALGLTVFDFVNLAMPQKTPHPYLKKLHEKSFWWKSSTRDRVVVPSLGYDALGDGSVDRSVRTERAIVRRLLHV